MGPLSDGLEFRLLVAEQVPTPNLAISPLHPISRTQGAICSRKGKESQAKVLGQSTEANLWLSYCHNSVTEITILKFMRARSITFVETKSMLCTYQYALYQCRSLFLIFTFISSPHPFIHPFLIYWTPAMYKVNCIWGYESSWSSVCGGPLGMSLLRQVEGGVS